MSKRFVDTEIWQKEWFQVLALKEKILVKYIFENCDCAGIWNGNFRMASFIIGENVSSKDLEEINKKKNLFEVLPDGKVFTIDFIEFQYGKLSPNCQPHKPVIALLKKYGLWQRVAVGYQKGIDTLPKENENSLKGLHVTLEEKEKEKEKDKDKDKEKEIEEEKKEDFISEDFKNPDLMFDKNVEKVFDIYEKNCKNCLPLKFERRNLDLRQDIFELLKLVKLDFSYIEQLCQKANELKKIYDNPIDIKAMVKNHERIFSGFYVRSSKTIPEASGQSLSPDEVLKKAGW